MAKKTSVLFVCLGNICRSPLAEGIFTSLLDERKLSNSYRVESRGTGSWHIGNQAHPETRRVALLNGIDLESHRARQLAVEDFGGFDLLVAMDRSNLEDMHLLAPPASGELVLLRDYDSEKGEPDVPDPYLGGKNGFQLVQGYRRLLLSQLVAGFGEEPS